MKPQNIQTDDGDDISVEPIGNELLGALPEKEFKKIEPLLKLVDLEQDETLWEMDEKRQYVYFPTTAMICLLYDTEEGTSIEVGMAGRKGMVGVVTFIGDARMAKRAVVNHEGQAYRIKAADVEKEFESCPAFHDICMSYAQTLIVQISQTAICNRLHSVEQQICRYLLINFDNLHTKTYTMTHEHISNVLGVRRESVSVAAAKLQKAGVIEYARGTLTILDRRRLKGAACECFDVVNEQYERIMGKYIKNHGV